MQVVISPYHLTTREPPAMAGLLLASRACTLMPAPAEGTQREQVRAATERVPRFLRLMESWRWTVPLWRAGVLASGARGEEVAADVRAAWECIQRDERLAPLRSFVRDEALTHADRYLEAVAADLLRAGPDPGVSVPVAAGLDRFAARFGMIVARSGSVSIVQRAEERLGARLAAAAIPVITQADGRVIVEAAALLAETLDPLRSSLAAVSAAGTELRDAVEAMRYAAREYESEFADRRAEILALGSDDEVAVRDGHVALALLRLPADAALDASLAAMNVVLGKPSPGSAANGAANGSAGRLSTLPAVSGGACVGPVTVMIVRTLGRGGSPGRI